MSETRTEFVIGRPPTEVRTGSETRLSRHHPQWPATGAACLLRRRIRTAGNHRKPSYRHFQFRYAGHRFGPVPSSRRYAIWELRASTTTFNHRLLLLRRAATTLAGPVLALEGATPHGASVAANPSGHSSPLGARSAGSPGGSRRIGPRCHHRRPAGSIMIGTGSPMPLRLVTCAIPIGIAGLCRPTHRLPGLRA